jgi:glycosyltransferase involved in cell wall biosynthesis
VGIKFTLCSRWAFPYHQGGIAMHNYYLLELLKDRMDLSLTSSQIEQNKSYYSFKHITFNGISADLPLVYWRLAKNKILQNGLRSLQDWHISLAMAKSIKFQPTDVIEFMDIHSEGYAYLRQNPRKNRKTKVIIRSHTPWGLLRSYYSNEERQGVDGWWSFNRENYCFQTCDAVTTPSQDLKNNLIKLYNLPEDKITVIPNIVDTNHFMPLPMARDDQPFTILHVGRFERAKGVITLIKAFIEFAKIDTECKLINVGQPRGSSYEECHELLKSADMIKKVKFTGFVSYEDLPRYYADSDVVVVASEIYESFSYTVAQAMACNKPVIASNIGGIPETLDSGRLGLLFEPGNIDSLFKKLSYIYNNQVRDISKGAREYAVNNFSFEKLGAVYNDYYMCQ